jgi:hypothetical protein
MGASRPDSVRSARGSRRRRETAAALAVAGVLIASAALAADSTSTATGAPPVTESPSKADTAPASTPTSTPTTPAVQTPPPAAQTPPAASSTPASVRKPAPGAPIARTAASTRKPVVASSVKKPSARPVSASPGIVQVTLPPVPQEERVTYHYNALGRRDPFRSLVDGFVGMDEGGDAAPDVGGIKVVGIVWGATDKFALVEDPRGNSLVLRQGDKVMNGVVEVLKRDALVVKLNVEGASQSITIPVTRKGDSNVQN